MRTPRWLVLGAVVAIAMVVAGGALGVGPWPGLAPTVSASSGDVRYTAVRAPGSTTVKAIRAGSVIASATFTGAFGIPAVTSAGKAGGLSPDGRLLVLAEPPTYESLRSESRFLVISTGSLSLAHTVVLGGEFGFDAVSPDRRTLFLIQHVSSEDLIRYVVRAYDLRAKRLLPGAIVDKREPAEAMRGYAIARATSPGGTWVYTLYTRGPDGRHPFVHALNAAARTAFCIDLPGLPAGDDLWRSRFVLSGRQLVVYTGGTVVARIDTRSLRVL
jgi:hypothetical protein